MRGGRDLNTSPEATKMRRLEKTLSNLALEKFLIEQQMREIYKVMKKLDPELEWGSDD